MDLSDSKTQEQLKTMLKDAILVLCKNTITYQSQLLVDGLIGISADSNTHLMLHIHDCQERESLTHKQNDSHSPESVSSESDGVACQPVRAQISIPKKKKKKNVDDADTQTRQISDHFFTDIKQEVLELSDEEERENHDRLEESNALVESDFHDVSIGSSIPPQGDCSLHHITSVFSNKNDPQDVNNMDVLEQQPAVKTENHNTPHSHFQNYIDTSNLMFSTGGGGDASIDGHFPQSSFEFGGQKSFQEFDMSAYKNKSFTFDRVCQTCGKSLSSAAALSRHVKIHQASAFSCQVCGKMFNRKDNLLRHVRGHGNEMQSGDENPP